MKRIYFIFLPHFNEDLSILQCHSGCDTILNLISCSANEENVINRLNPTFSEKITLIDNINEQISRKKANYI